MRTDSLLFKGLEPEAALLDEPYRLYQYPACGLRGQRLHPPLPLRGMEDAANGLYAVQFHPEVLHTVNGAQMLKNFLFEICGCAGDWRMDSFVETSVAAIREQIGDSRVLCGLSAAWIPRWPP